MDIYKDLAKQSKKLMFKEPFYGMFLMGINKVISNQIDTACVAPQNINLQLVINPDYWEKQEENTRLAILKHELLHITMFHLNHFDRYSNKKLYNVAADLEINQYIDKSMKGGTWEGLEFDEGLFTILQLEPKKGTKYYYDKIKDFIDKNPGSDLAKFVDDNDDHTLWEEFKNMDEATKKLIQKQIDHQLKEVAKNSPGDTPGELKSYIDKLFEKKPPILDWKQYVRRFSSKASTIKTKKTRYKPNRRFGQGPALKITQDKSLLVAIDTSGSVSEKDLQDFFNEINHIHNAGICITVIECDTRIGRIYEYKKNQDNSVTGRGGTSFEPVFKYWRDNMRKYDSLIYLTDGEAYPPETRVNRPTLWIHSRGRSINDDLPGAKIKMN